ncbi:hypothetical protein [Chryseobacterium chendengshani]|uniref:hypothetical protein n=1 Tax=Chryseobacterium sp. LJ756 TaxID=2864113 RepID=UPI001C64011A|nr:hypothetical protein [Chryseobacterium sp. LJ756]MBW7675659.1 hypothetical protein [Chryseobacterium sp. LJ756]
MENTDGSEPDYLFAIARFLNFLCFGQTQQPEPNSAGHYLMGDFRFSNPYYLVQREIVADFLTNFKEVTDQECIYENHPKKTVIDKFLKDAIQHTSTIYYDTFYEGGAIRIIIVNMEKELLKLIYFPAITFAYVRYALPYDHGNRTHITLDEYNEILYKYGILLESEELNFDDLEEKEL